MPETNERRKIARLETTNDNLTSRGGLAFFVKYVEAVGVMRLLLAKFEGIRKNAKGVTRCEHVFARCCISSSTERAGT